MHLSLVLTYLSKIFLILRNTLPWPSKKIVHILFCVFQTEFNKAVNIFCRLTEWIRNVLIITGFNTRLGWERGWKSCLANSKDWRSENVNAIELNCKAVKKVAIPYFYINLPSSGLFLLSSKKVCTALPQVTQFLEGHNTPLLITGRGVPTMIMQAVFSVVYYARDCFYCSYAGDSFFYGYVGDSFK